MSSFRYFARHSLINFIGKFSQSDIENICSVDAAFHKESEYIIFKIATERNFY